VKPGGNGNPAGVDTVVPRVRVLGPALDLPPGWVEPYTLTDIGLRLCVTRVDGLLYAVGDRCGRCPSAEPLSAGLLDGRALRCRACGSRYDVATGAVLDGPATQPLPTYEVREVGGEISIWL
jgi:3-phenylpropionate/trans-cinnamate dioxygenase ferredoxin component